MFDRLSKYGSTPTRCRQGTMHQSKLESRRCDELHILQGGNEISDLKAHPQPRYRLEVNGTHICDVQPDFEYLDRDGKLVTEDAKGVFTEVARIKYKLFEALFGRPIQLVRKVR